MPRERKILFCLPDKDKLRFFFQLRVTVYASYLLHNNAILIFLYQNGPGLFGALNDEIPYADLDEGLRQRNIPAPDPPSDEQVGDR